jgi:hypothetical protein
MKRLLILALALCLLFGCQPTPDHEIVVAPDGNGVRSFFWTDPTAKPQLVNEAVAVLPFEEVQDTILTHIRHVCSYGEEDAIFREWYEGRARYLIEHVGLYMEMLPKKNDLESFYYGPVWIVTVRGYPADADVPALPDTMTTTYLHVNAIDGSLVGY